jgi:hypothetical protein
MQSLLHSLVHQDAVLRLVYLYAVEVRLPLMDLAEVLHDIENTVDDHSNVGKQCPGADVIS